MAGTITHVWNGTILTITTDSGTSSADLKGAKGDMGIRGPQGAPGNTTTADLTAYATKDYVDEALKNVKPETPEVEVDLSDYYTKEETDDKIQTAVGAIPSVDLTGYATEQFVQDKITEAQLGDEVDLTGYATEEYVDGAVTAVEEKVYEVVAQTEEDRAAISDLEESLASNYYQKSEVDNKIQNVTNSMSGYATETYVQQQIQAIPTTDLTGYATKDYIDNKGYATENYVSTKIAEAQLSGGSGSGSVDLSGYASKDYVDDAIDDIGISNYATKSYVLSQIDKIDVPETDLTNYYTKSQVDAKIPNLSPYAKTETVRSLLEEERETTNTNMGTTLQNYYTKSEADVITAGLITEGELQDALAKVEVAIDNETIIKEDGVLKTAIGGSKKLVHGKTYYTATNSNGWTADAVGYAVDCILLTGAQSLADAQLPLDPNALDYNLSLRYKLVYSSNATDGQKVEFEGRIREKYAVDNIIQGQVVLELVNFPEVSDSDKYVIIRDHFNRNTPEIVTEYWNLDYNNFTVYELSIIDNLDHYECSPIDIRCIDTNYIATRQYVRDMLNEANITTTVDNGSGNVTMACSAVIASDDAGDGNIVLGGID